MKNENYKFRAWDKKHKRYVYNHHFVFTLDGKVFNLQTGEDETDLIIKPIVLKNKRQKFSTLK
jgi:hypothetical protein